LASLTFELCPGYELVVTRQRGAISTPPEGGAVHARQRNERVLRLFKLTWESPGPALFREFLERFRRASGTTLAMDFVPPGEVDPIEVTFNAPPQRVHGTAGRGERVEIELAEVR
jgi:hypothetical protein